MNESNPTAVSTGIEGLDEILRGGIACCEPSPDAR
jgi:hypothetical protein